jgi:hypothetical protein
LLSVDTAGTPTGSTWRRDRRGRGEGEERRGEEIGRSLLVGAGSELVGGGSEGESFLLLGLLSVRPKGEASLLLGLGLGLLRVRPEGEAPLLLGLGLWLLLRGKRRRGEEEREKRSVGTRFFKVYAS